jgi:hypothetical protein
MGIKDELSARSPRGKRMIDTREQFEYMADLYDKALVKARKINGQLRADNANLKAKLQKRS